jgi:aspartate aminotransferase
VLVFSPYWTPIKDLVAHCQGRIVLVPTEEARANGFAETLARYSTSDTRAIYFNTPTNPSGVVFNRTKQRKLPGSPRIAISS